MPAGLTAQAGRARRLAPGGRRPRRSAGFALGMRPSTPRAPVEVTFVVQSRAALVLDVFRARRA